MARAERRVLLFDGDLGLANLDIQLGLMPKNDLGRRAGRTFELGPGCHLLRRRRV